MDIVIINTKIAKKNEKSSKVFRFTLIVYVPLSPESQKYIFIHSWFLSSIFRPKRHGNSDNQLKGIIEDIENDSPSSKGFHAIVKKKLGAMLSFKIKDTKPSEIINHFKASKLKLLKYLNFDKSYKNSTKIIYLNVNYTKTKN